MEFRDYEKILGVSRDANDRAFNRVVYQLTRRYLPDNTPGKSEAEKIVNDTKEAFQWLGDSASYHDQRILGPNSLQHLLRKGN